FPAMSPEKRDTEMVEKSLREMEQSLERLRGLIQPGPFLVGHAPSLADCAFSQTLMLAGMMWKELGAEWSLGKELDDWQQMMGELAPVQSVLEPAREATESWLEGKRASV
ncbi:MAG: glutathione S-transferase domain-containing protein, partial [SAR324 cluster bacterium]|nr:glutathione S-transferase domain-containing protein [SAR324 cluster bacterium]